MTDNGRAALFMSASMAMFAVEDAFLKVLTRTMPVWQLLAMVGVAVSYTHLTLPTTPYV